MRGINTQKFYQNLPKLARRMDANLGLSYYLTFYVCSIMDHSQSERQTGLPLSVPDGYNENKEAEYSESHLFLLERKASYDHNSNENLSHSWYISYLADKPHVLLLLGSLFLPPLVAVK